LRERIKGKLRESGAIFDPAISLTAAAHNMWLLGKAEGTHGAERLRKRKIGWWATRQSKTSENVPSVQLSLLL
jgi:hypothetical protein